MNYLRSNKKLKRLLVLLSAFFLMASSIVAVNYRKAVKTDAAHDYYAYIAIKDDTGYIASQQYDFMRKDVPYSGMVDLLKTPVGNIFLCGEPSGGVDTYLDDIKKVVFLDKVSIYHGNDFFKELRNLEEIVNIENLDTSAVEAFEYMFYQCENLKSADFSKFDTSSCTNFRNMFNGSSFEQLDLSNFDTSKGTDFRYMFADCRKLESVDLSSFNTENAENMYAMFDDCVSLKTIDISSFDLSKSPLTEAFFFGTHPDFVVGPKHVPEYHDNFDNVIKFDLPQENEDKLYFYDYNLNNYTCVKPSNEPIVYCSESIKKTIESIVGEFYSSLDSKIDLDNLDADVIGDLVKYWKLQSESLLGFYPPSENELLYLFFENCDKKTKNSEIVSKGLTLYEEIYNECCYVLEDGGDFFNRCPNAFAKDDLVRIGVDTTNNIGYLSPVNSFEILTSDLRCKVDLSNKTITNSIFSLLGDEGWENITKIVIQDQISIPSAANLFKELSKVTSIDGLKHLNITEENLSFGSMFEGCSSLESVDLAGIETKNLVCTDAMFKDCSNLAEINFGTFNTSDITSMNQMFYGCKSLSLLDLSNFDLSKTISAVDCLNNASFLYLKTPKVMPNSLTLGLYFPYEINDFAYYDLSFDTYESLSNTDNSKLIISFYGKGILDGICDDFIKDCEYYCLADGSTSSESLIKLWEGQSKGFANHLDGTSSECLKEYFKQDNLTCVDTKLKSFCEKYDYIYGKYSSLLNEHGGDFAERSDLISFINNSPVSVFDIKSNDPIVLICVVVVSISIVGMSLYFSHKKHIN